MPLLGSCLVVIVSIGIGGQIFPADLDWLIEPDKDRWVSMSTKLITLSFSEDIIYLVVEMVDFWNIFF